MERALHELRSLFNDSLVLGREEAMRDYGANTLGRDSCPVIAAAVRPRSTEHVISVVQTASRHHIPLYPISTGHNWGYGCALPSADNCIIVDLSDMNAIIEVDGTLDTVTLQPGVTQQMLRRHLDERGLRYMVPTTGAGPTCSLVGNALERGYGPTPYTDHFDAVTSLEAVLPNGQVYRPATRGANCVNADRSYKWGVGPYLDGLFAQGAFGIVTEMTLRLAPIPEQAIELYFTCRDDSALEELVLAYRAIQRSYAGNIGTLKLMNAHAMAAATSRDSDQPRPVRRRNRDNASSSGAPTGQPAWVGIGTIYGPRPVARVVAKGVKRALRGHVDRLWMITPGLLRTAGALIGVLPGIIRRRLDIPIEALAEGLGLMTGVPSELMLRTAYSCSQQALGDRPLNPSKDGCGVIWYAPIVPMHPESVRAQVSLVTNTCIEYSMPPLVNFSTVGPGCLMCTTPLLFDVSDGHHAERAWQCYRDLVERGRANGSIPYRLPHGECGLIADENPVFWNTVRDIKSALDPHGIIAPGRYCPTERLPLQQDLADQRQRVAFQTTGSDPPHRTKHSREGVGP